MRDPASPSRRPPLADVTVLLVADRRGRHAAAVARRRPHGEPAPPAADLEHVIGGRELQRPADAIDLLGLRLLERIGGRLEVAARIHQQLGVEEQAEELVAEVVVPVDVPAAAGRGSCRAGGARCRPPAGAARPRRGSGPSSNATVAQHQPRQRHQIRRRPVAVHEGLADADVAAGERAQEEPLVVDDQRRIQAVAIARTGTCGPGTPAVSVPPFMPPRPERNARPRPLRHHAHRSITESVRPAVSAATPHARPRRRP